VRTSNTFIKEWLEWSLWMWNTYKGRKINSYLAPSLKQVYLSYIHSPRSWGSSVGIASGYELDDRGVGVRVPVGSGIFSSPRRPDRLWGSPNLLCNGYRWLFPRR
jgi:hypothetical protein